MKDSNSSSPQEKGESLNNHQNKVISVTPMRKKERRLFLFLGIMSIFGGLSSFLGSIITNSPFGFILSIPFMLVGTTLIIISIKSK